MVTDNNRRSDRHSRRGLPSGWPNKNYNAWFSPSRNQETIFNVKTQNFDKRWSFLACLAHSSDRLDLFRRWHLKDILYRNQEILKYILKSVPPIWTVHWLNVFMHEKQKLLRAFTDCHIQWRPIVAGPFWHGHNLTLWVCDFFNCLIVFFLKCQYFLYFIIVYILISYICLFKNIVFASSHFYIFFK